MVAKTTASTGSRGSKRETKSRKSGRDGMVVGITVGGVEIGGRVMMRGGIVMMREDIVMIMSGGIAERLWKMIDDLRV